MKQELTNLEKFAENLELTIMSEEDSMLLEGMVGTSSAVNDSTKCNSGNCGNCSNCGNCGNCVDACVE